ncbi:unnamed protein product [Amaranthus hypochondriacus]
MEKNSIRVCIVAILCMGMCFYVGNAGDPSLLQDFCVALTHPSHSPVFINGKVCKNPNEVEMSDFVYKGFNIPGNTNDNPQQANATLVDINHFPGLNTLGVSFARVDFGPFGLNTPHWHPRGSEIFAVMEGSLYAGFVTTDNKLWDTVINKGDVIVFPQALMHFQLNLGDTNAYAIAAFGTQNPGRVEVANTVFGSNPPIAFTDVLTKAFQVGVKDIQQLQSQFNNGTTTSLEYGRSILKLLSQRA